MDSSTSGHDAFLVEGCAIPEHLSELLARNPVEDEKLAKPRYRNGDCSGHEKARRIQQRYELERFDTIYAYGDTSEDAAMMARPGLVILVFQSRPIRFLNPALLTLTG